MKNNSTCKENFICFEQDDFPGANLDKEDKAEKLKTLVFFLIFSSLCN